MDEFHGMREEFRLRETQLIVQEVIGLLTRLVLGSRRPGWVNAKTA